ncbi:MAG: hypothetical protein QW165_05075 [Candidatus Woesearchaeota archaeon]
MPDATLQDFKKVQWSELRAAAVKDLETERAELARSLPRDEKDIAQWKAYYQRRVVCLENEAINIAARLIWTNCSDKEGLIRRYLDILNLLIQGINREEDLHVLESMMKVYVQSEARRLRAEHPEFFC